MGKDSAIEWTDATWNPWMGCTKVSEGCKNCYMFRDQNRFGNDPTKLRRSKTTFHDPLNWKDPRMIFVCSWSDFFHPDIPEKWRTEAWNIMLEADHHTYLILTKRIENFRKYMPVWWGDYPWEHIWLGVSVENQKYADERIPQLMKIPAMVHFVSAEPLLGSINLSKYLGFLDWIITGGESGPNARPMSLDWIRSIRDECIMDEDIAFFHKQHGGSKKINGAWGGRELDGRTWDEFPS